MGGSISAVSLSWKRTQEPVEKAQPGRESTARTETQSRGREEGQPQTGTRAGSATPELPSQVRTTPELSSRLNVGTLQVGRQKFQGAVTKNIENHLDLRGSAATFCSSALAARPPGWRRLECSRAKWPVSALRCWALLPPPASPFPSSLAGQGWGWEVNGNLEGKLLLCFLFLSSCCAVLCPHPDVSWCSGS